jgi:hypothetical protein
MGRRHNHLLDTIDDRRQIRASQLKPNQIRRPTTPSIRHRQHRRNLLTSTATTIVDYVTGAA